MLLGFQHMFAMFGATVLVPILTGLDVSTTLLFAGLGTLLFHLLTKRQGPRVPRLVLRLHRRLRGHRAHAGGCSRTARYQYEMLPYACFGVACAGLVYVILSALFKAFGAKKVMRFFPPIVTGPIIICHRPDPVLLRHQQLHTPTGWIAIVGHRRSSSSATSGARA